MQQTQTHDRMYQEQSSILSCAVLEALENDPFSDAEQVRTAAVAYEVDMRGREAGESAEAGEEGEEGGETASEQEEFEAIIQEANALIDEAIRLQEAATASETGGEEEEKEPDAASSAAEAVPEDAADGPATEEDEDFVAEAKKPARSAARGKSGASRGGRKHG
jgi:hypothetical protein